MMNLRVEKKKNGSAGIYADLTEKEQEKALSILRTLDGLEIERARRILSFCNEALKTKADVKIIEAEGIPEIKGITVDLTN